ILDGKFLEINDQVGKEVKQQEDFKALVEEIKKHIPSFSSEELKVSLAYEADSVVRVESKTNEIAEDVVSAEVLEFTNEAKNVEIIVIAFNMDYGVLTKTKAIIDTGALDNNFKGFEVIDGEVIEIFSEDGQFVENEKPNLPNNPEYIPGQIMEAKANWSIGTWCLRDKAGKFYKHCGPGCGDYNKTGGGTPINKIDECCRAHDRCWRNFGKGDNCCDKEIEICAARYKSQDPATYYQIALYFLPQGALCRK
ncbi:MAG: hypothetical protein ABF649_23210, partial [Bacillus sp. (in: firmicutes)]